MPHRNRFAVLVLACLTGTHHAWSQEAVAPLSDPFDSGEVEADRTEIDGSQTEERTEEAAQSAEQALEMPPELRRATNEVDDSRDPIGDADALLRSGYDPTGIRAGSFIIYPSVDVGTVYTSNVHQSPDDRADDVGALVAPQLRVQSDWSRHSLEFNASSSHLRYEGYPEEDVNEATVRADLRLDVTSRTTVDTGASFQLGQEERDSVEVPQGAVSSPEILTWSGSAGVTHRFNRLTASLRGEVDYLEYGDTDLGGGASEDNGDRDYVEGRGTLRLGYEISPAVQPFIQATYSVREHDREVDRNGLRRDSEGYALSGGVVVNASPIISGEISGGYVRRKLDDPSLDVAEGATFDAKLTWSPTRLTTIEATASTSVEETTLVGASEAIDRAVGLDLTHSLGYNLTAKASASYSHTDYSGIDLDEDRISAQASLEYLLNPNVVLRTGYVYRWYESSQPNSEYDAHTVKVDVKLQR